MSNHSMLWEIDKICEILCKMMPATKFGQFLRENDYCEPAVNAYRKVLKELTGEEDVNKIDICKIQKHPDSLADYSALDIDNYDDPILFERDVILYMLAKIMPASEFRQLLGENVDSEGEIYAYRKVLRDLTGDEDFNKVDISKIQRHPDSVVAITERRNAIYRAIKAEMINITSILAKIMPWSKYKKLVHIYENLGCEIALPKYRKALKKYAGNEDYKKIDENKFETHHESLLAIIERERKARGLE